MKSWIELADMMQTGLFASALAEPVTLAGQPVRAIVSRGIQLIGDYGQVIGQQTQIDLPANLPAEQGDTVTINGTDYLLDALVSNDGHITRWVIRVDA